MNRQILFRGKRIDNDEWVYGDLLTPTDIMDIWEISENTGMGDRYEVKPETVGQFTNLIDMNGNKIFEGDILKIISSVQGEIDDYTRLAHSVKREDCAVVLRDDKTGGYKLKVYHKGKYKRIAKFAVGHLIVYKAEVIGNIYDNSDLLGETK